MPPKKKTKQTLPTDRFLLIVESPSKCKKIEEYLGEKYQCISSKGHFRSIESLSNINVKDRFQIEFTVMADKLDCVNAMQSAVKQYPPENILLATDDDREGEAIAWHICQVCSLDPLTTKRIVFHEITQPAIVAAVSHPTTINLSLVYAQQARQVLDLVVGFTISPLLWKHVSRNKKSPLSAGRCQTPALRLVHDHDCLYKSTAAGSVLWQVHATFTPHLLSFQLNAPFAKTERDALQEFLHQSRTFVHEVTVGATRDAYQSPPKPFNTSRLLQIASQTLKLSPKTTMGLAQILYQSGLITYMRTDCQKYAQVFLDKAALFIQEKYGVSYIGPLDTVVLQDATMPHEAIRCTNVNMQQFQHENNQLVRLYQLIWRNTVESCMSSYRYQTTEVTVTAPQNRFFTKKIETPTFWGWQRVAGEFADTTGGGELTDTQSAENSLLLYLKQVRGGVSWTSIDTKTVAEGRLPPHYTEASLIQKLEDMGIGRPSTFASLVETIQERGYVKKMDVPGATVICEDFHIKREVDTLSTVVTEKIFGQEKNKLVLQPTGSLALEFLLTHFDDCFSYGYTAEMEHRLDVLASLDVAAAEQTWFLSAKEMFDIIHERSKPLVAKKPMFPLADRADYVLVFSSYGGSLKRIVDDEENSSTPKYVKIRPDMNLDIERAKRGEYTFQELAWRTDDGCLGMHEGKNLYLKKGRYGLYAEWGSNRMSMKVLEDEGKEAGSIRLEDVLQVIQAAQTKQEAVAFAAAHCLPHMDPEPQGPTSAQPLPKTVLRILRPDLSIRKGKFGAYIYHQSSTMKTPAFFPLKPIAKQWEQMDNNELIAWIENTYQPNA